VVSGSGRRGQSQDVTFGTWLQFDAHCRCFVAVLVTTEVEPAQGLSGRQSGGRQDGSQAQG
jgi:hypothetical protein